MDNLENGLDLSAEMYFGALQVMKTNDSVNTEEILKKKGQILDLDIDMRKGHMKRVATGTCAAKLTAAFGSILHSIDRMGNSCVNIAEAVSGPVVFDYFTGIRVEQ